MPGAELAHAGDPLPITVLDSPQAVTRQADILCTLTPSLNPVVHGEWFHPGLRVGTAVPLTS